MMDIGGRDSLVVSSQCLSVFGCLLAFHSWGLSTVQSVAASNAKKAAKH